MPGGQFDWDGQVISAQIVEVCDKGDLSENAEYDAAKEAQGMLEMKISQMKETLVSVKPPYTPG